MVFFISVSKIFGDADYLIIFLLLFLYGLSIITLSFFFTSFMNQAKNTVTIQTLSGFMTIIILSHLNYIHIFVDTSVVVKWLTSLSAPVPLGLGLTEVCVLRPLINLGIIIEVKATFFWLFMFPYKLHSYFLVVVTVSTKDFCKILLPILVFNIEQIWKIDKRLSLLTARKTISNDFKGHGIQLMPLNLLNIRSKFLTGFFLALPYDIWIIPEGISGRF